MTYLEAMSQLMTDQEAIELMTARPELRELVRMAGKDPAIVQKFLAYVESILNDT